MNIPFLGDPLTRECHSNITAYHHGGERSQASIRYVVMHSTEGGTARSVAQYFQTPQSGGSANLVIDPSTCYRTLADTIIPWGAPPLNTHGFHIEQCGYAAWTRNEWLTPSNRRMLRRAAYKAALRCQWYKIPVRLLNVEQLKKDFGLNIVGGVPQTPGPMQGGFVTHATIDLAYHESDHHDPGLGWPSDIFLDYVNAYLLKLKG